jgi:hypothetical protein
MKHQKKFFFFFFFFPPSPFPLPLFPRGREKWIKGKKKGKKRKKEKKKEEDAMPPHRQSVNKKR